MSGSTISTTISTYVYVGGGSYASPLTITNTGAVVGLTPPGDSFGHSAIRDTDATGTIINHGVLLGSGSETLLFGASGVSMLAGYLYSDGSIAGGYGAGVGGAGVDLLGGSVHNLGTLTGGDGSNSGGSGASLNGGTLRNLGTITGGTGSVSGGSGISIDAGYALNSRTVAGGYGGDAGGDGASVQSESSTNAYGTVITTFSTLVNAGLIEGGDGATAMGLGIRLSDGILVNGGTILGGVSAYGGTVTNGGYIEGTIANSTFGSSPDAVYFEPSSQPSRLIVLPGAIFNGGVNGSGTSFELAEGADVATSTLQMGGSFAGFDNITFDYGASWLLGGTTAELAGGEVISGFAASDTLSIGGFTATSHTYVAGTGLELSDGTATATLDITGSFSNGSFIVLDTSGATEVLLCYLRGTRILTPAGEVPVEALQIGDAVITRFGGYRRIKWIGRQSFGRRFIQNQREQIPVRIRAGALAPSLPKRDLFVSPGHSMLLGDVLVLARHLINGVTITQDACPDEVHYYQVEFETHDCVLAEGVWSESFCDYAGLRNQFHNVSEFHALYPAHVTPAEHLMCAPRPEAGPALAAALGPVVARAGACTTAGPLRGWIDNVDPGGNVAGWASDTTNPELPMKLEILLHGRVIGGVLACDYREDLAIAKIGRGRCGFNFNAGAIARRSLSTLQVRRVADEAVIPMSPNCLTEIGAAPRRKSA